MKKAYKYLYLKLWNMSIIIRVLKYLKWYPENKKEIIISIFLKAYIFWNVCLLKKVAKLLIGIVEFIVKLIKIYCSRNILIDEFKMLL